MFDRESGVSSVCGGVPPRKWLGGRGLGGVRRVHVGKSDFLFSLISYSIEKMGGVVPCVPSVVGAR